MALPETYPFITDPFFYLVTVPAVLLPTAPLGVWLGVRLARRISQVLFYRFLYAGMLLTGVKLLWDAAI